MAIRFWLGVVQRDHVREAVRLGIAQLNYGSREAISRLGEADGLVYYSPRESADGAPLRAFTAIGRVADDEVYSADRRADASARHWRRRMDWYRPAIEAPIRPLKPHLDLTRSSRTWGVKLRPGLVELSRHDWDAIRLAMRMPAPEDRRPHDRIIADVVPELRDDPRWY
ncbi:EVE domain-containing protein [Paramicrobacterium agarici]|uniref:EVE domain-containing protein n=1 Tax=Paramicrobacterium agarici TaxID=630514 RepID=UPI001150A84A|nr:EVE domain-containing protein [Microbacterium agarici]TQO23543.1 EVE domain-containing protein [Microbacterium agarici]